MSNILEMKNIYKSFNGIEVLHDVEFNVRRGECIAVCGENGAGKSTLMKILAGIYDYEGTITYKGELLQAKSPLEVQKKGISMIHQELNLIDEMSVAQNIYLSREPRKNGFIDFKKMEKDAAVLLQELEPINPGEKVKRLGIAKKQIVEIAKALSFNADLIIMDEPTAVLTQKETDMLFDLIKKLKAQGVSVVYISHRLKEIMEICDRVTVLRDGGFIATKEISEITEKQIAELMVGREIAETNQTKYDGSGEVVLKVKGLTDHFLKNVSFELMKGEVIGIFGLLGAGRSEVAEVIFGLRKVTNGEVYVNGELVKIKNPKTAIKHRIAFATEDRKGTGLFLERSIRDNGNIVRRLMTKGFLINRTKELEITNNMINAFRIKCNNPQQKIKNLSGGNQQKVVLGKWVEVNPDILILDEPTRGVDVGARKEIYDEINRLAKQGKSIIVISSDLTEILAVSQRVIIMHEGTIRGEILGAEITEENSMVLATGIN